MQPNIEDEEDEGDTFYSISSSLDQDSKRLLLLGMEFVVNMVNE